jgi:intracellular sulfur oxidation DsrE/DsrF family protein
MSLSLSRTLTLAAAVLLLPRLSAAQEGEALIRKAGAFAPIPNPSFAADKSVELKVVWDVTETPATPSDVVSGFSRPANFFLLADAEGVPRARVHLALLVHGGSTPSLMTNEHYKAAKGVDNPNIPLLKAMADAGVQIIVCGQSIVRQKIAREQLLPFVKVSTSATIARAVLHAQGYTTMVP